ncbi:MAG: hypothetical protein A3F18_03725 [Legionellales bacterium RIFCSPHIGHO2_12_FULL_37_14]|nr:MAG: hypothetical protein A3F18_03725 [Legionellales bacterium RIFCSPHIGHO2_12_FULL_37_14]
MSMHQVLVVRVYVLESEHLLKTILNYLKNEAKIRGVSVFRAISGFGGSGEHQTTLVDLSLDLPLVIEFFDVKTKIEPAIAHLATMVKHEHLIYWEARVH